MADPPYEPVQTPPSTPTTDTTAVSGGSNNQPSHNNSSSPSSSPMQLQKQLGLMNGVGIIVGIVIGSGIFVSPKGVIMETGSVGACLVVWALCGVICIAGALCYAELGTCIMVSGADYSYLRESLGDLPGFLFLWVDMVVINPASCAVTALTFATYVLQPAFPDCGAPQSAVTLVAALCICVLTFINCRNVSWATRVQDGFTFTKIIALALIIVVGIVKIAMGNTENFSNSFEGTTKDPGKMALAFYSGLFSYSGWNCLNLVTEELKSPHKNLPRAILVSLPLVTVVYILTNVAYFAVLTPQEMVASDATAVTFADRTLGVMSWVMPIFVACSTFGSLNGTIFTCARMAFVGARNGHMPGVMATISVEHMTPLPALLMVGAVSTMWLCSSDVFALINYTCFAETCFFCLVVIGLIVLRVTRPDMERPIKIPIAIPILYLVVTAFLVVTPLTLNPMECLMGLVLILTGIPVYVIGVMWKRKPKWMVDSFESFTTLVQKTFAAVHEESHED